jgi:hypothetical protein
VGNLLGLAVLSYELGGDHRAGGDTRPVHGSPDRNLRTAAVRGRPGAAGDSHALRPRDGRRQHRRRTRRRHAGSADGSTGIQHRAQQEDRRGTNGSPIVVASRTASHSSCDGSFAPIVGIRPCGAGHLAHHELSSARHRGGGVEGRPWLGLWMTVHSVLMILAGNCLRCGGRQSRRCPALDWRGPDRRRASDRGGCRAAGGFPDRGGRSARSRLRGDGCVSASTVGLGSELCS